MPEMFLSGAEKWKTDCRVNFVTEVQINIAMYVLLCGYDMDRTVTLKMNKMFTVFTNTATIILEFFIFFYNGIRLRGYASRLKSKAIE